MPRTPFKGVFSGANGAGPRRIAGVGAVAVVLLGGSAVVLLAEHHKATTTTVAAAPHADPLPGGAHSNPEYERDVKEQSQFENARAQANGNSYVSSMAGHIETPAPAPELAALAARPIPVSAHPLATQANPFQAAQPVVATSILATVQAPKIDLNQEKAYGDAMRGLFESMTGVAPAIEVVEPPATTSDTAGQGPNDGQPVRDAANRTMLPGSSGSDPTMARQLPKRVLISAGKAIYGLNKLAVSSDQNGAVVVTAESGPIAGDEMIGSFQTKGNRLVVVLQSLTLANGQQEPINALVISPDSMETAVATSVDQHYVARFALPVAAAFVQGLGQAIAESNTTSQVSALGGVTAFTHLNTGQILGVAAGTAGQQAGQTLARMAPSGPTVKLAAGANVGVIFLSDLLDTSP